MRGRDDRAKTCLQCYYSDALYGARKRIIAIVTAISNPLQRFLQRALIV